MDEERVGTRSTTGAGERVPLVILREPYVQIASIGRKLEGTSNPRHAFDLVRNEYLLKTPEFAPEQFHVAANEIIGAQLARRVGVKTPGWRIGYYQQAHRYHFASEWPRDVIVSPFLDDHGFASCKNQSDAHRLVLLDGWTCNTDRNHRNMIVRWLKNLEGRGYRAEMTAIDHGHCLLNPGEKRADLFERLESAPGRYVQISCIRYAVVDRAMINSGLDAIEGILETELRDMVSLVPDALLPSADKGMYVEFLMERQRRLRDLFYANLGYFPQL